MITQALVLEVQRLLTRDRMSQRSVAKLVGISRSTVCKIASGRRPAWPDRAADHDAVSLRPTGPIARCGTCGGRVYMPCRLCHVRQLKQVEQDARREHRAAS